MSVKSVVKTLAAAALVAGTASAVAAGPSSAIFTGGAQNFKNSVELDLVTASANGQVDIYNYHGGERGALLGSEAVNAGANSDVNIGITPTSSESLVAVLIVDGVEVSTQDIDKSDN